MTRILADKTDFLSVLISFIRWNLWTKIWIINSFLFFVFGFSICTFEIVLNIFKK